jgi:hypothetical protein
MTAKGLSGSYGVDSGVSPFRRADSYEKSVDRASKLHYKHGATADQVKQMSDDEWGSLFPDAPDLDRGYVAGLMRHYEHFQPTPSAPSNRSVS